MLDEQFRPLPDFSAADGVSPRSGLREWDAWRNQATAIARSPIRLRIDIVGLRPEDARHCATYVVPVQ